MKSIVLSVLLLSAALPLLAADQTEWLTDLAKAQARAKAEKKLVLMEFTGSDWCPPCKQLHKTVMTSPEFEAYARTNLVLVEVDFPQTHPQSEELKKANRDLAQRFGIEGFPTVIVLDGNGKQLSKEVGYGGEQPDEFVAKIEKLRKKAQQSSAARPIRFPAYRAG